MGHGGGCWAAKRCDDAWTRRDRGDLYADRGSQYTFGPTPVRPIDTLSLEMTGPVAFEELTHPAAHAT